MAQINPEINGKTRLLGLLGSGIGYSYSPSIHNFSAALLGYNQVYVPFDLTGDAVEDFLQAFWRIGGVGLNVTTPHKEIVASLVPGHNLKSVNTIYRGRSCWQASSTDADGLAAAITHMGINIKGFRRFVFLGSGGVVTAILTYVARHFESMPEVYVLRRNPARDEQLRCALPSTFRLSCLDFNPEVFSSLVKGGAGETLVIQATSAPHQGDDLSRFACGIERFNGVLIDVVYGAQSALLKAAKQRGIPCQDGLPMLIEQARSAQHLWWGKAAAYADIFEFLTGALPPILND